MKKLIKKSFHRKEKGFTLIELLIVIVIIGILAGVLIAVINPVRQQNRARNAAVRAAVLKAAFAVNTVRAGIGTLPSNSSLTEELENFLPGGSWDDADGNTTQYCDQSTIDDLDCYFSLSGTNLPGYCSDASPSIPTNGGTADCLMHLVNIGTDLIDGQFRLASPKFALDTANGPYEYYLFSSSSGLLLCPNTQAYGAGVSDATLTGACSVVVDE